MAPLAKSLSLALLASCAAAVADEGSLSCVAAGASGCSSAPGGDEAVHLQVVSATTATVTPVVAKLLATATDSTPQTDCGGHLAWNCTSCPQGHGQLWCNGDCEWEDNACVDKNRPQVNCGGHHAQTCASCPAGNGQSWCNGDCQWESNDNAQGGNCVAKPANPTPAPTPTPAPHCDLSACNGCSGSQCTTCRENEKVKCCFEEKCRGCSGEQCQYCKRDNCCSGEYSWVPECQQATPAPTPAPAPACDLSACNGCSGSQCTSCRDDEQVKCCFEEKCRGCSGEQCQYCKRDNCCSGEYSSAQECQITPEVPQPTCSVGASVQCPGSSANVRCQGNQCCPGIGASNGQDFVCPSASPSFSSCPYRGKVQDCVSR